MPELNTSIEKPLFRSPRIFSRFPNLITGESTRHGGISTGAFTSLNLGGQQDAAEHVLENNHRFFNALNVPFEQVAKSHQVHGVEIFNVTEAGRFDGYDALITNLPGIQLAVTIADCTPILIFDPVHGVTAAIHAGWRGTVGEIVFKTVKKMVTTFGTNAKDCVAYVGTCIDECSFEVGEDVANHFRSKYKRWDNAKGKFFVDLKSTNRDQLLSAGLDPQNIEISAYSTVLDNEDYFSYRKENGITGRLLATIGRLA